MVYKIILPDKNEVEFDDKEGAIKAARENASKQNKVVAVKQKKDNKWEQVAIAYPNGAIQEGAGGFGFFKNLPVGRVR